MQDIQKETIVRAAEGDMNSFEEIYRISSGYVYTVALRVANNAEDAEEVTQDVFLSVYRNLRRFQFRSSFKTWLYRITTNTAINAYKKRKRQQGKSVVFDESIKTEGSAEASEALFDKQHNEALVRKALEILPPDQRACVVLKDIEGLKYKEIAETLSININTVRSRLKRARQKLMSAERGTGRQGSKEARK